MEMTTIECYVVKISKFDTFKLMMALEWLFLNFVAIFNTLKNPWIAIFLKSTLIKV